MRLRIAAQALKQPVHVHAHPFSALLSLSAAVRQELPLLQLNACRKI
jgi:hypothetical protein